MEEPNFSHRASKQLVDELEEAWELLRYTFCFWLPLYSSFSALTGSPSNRFSRQGQPPKSREQSRQNANRPTLNMACSISIVFVYFSTKKHRPRGISTKSIPKHVHKRNSNNPNRKPQGQHLQQCDVEDFGQIQRMTTQTYKEFLNKHCKL